MTDLEEMLREELEEAWELANIYEERYNVTKWIIKGLLVVLGTIILLRILEWLL